MTSPEKLLSNELSGNYQSVRLPADLIARCDGLGSDAILLLLGYFELLSRQEVSSDVVELYILLDHMPPVEDTRWQIALAELLEEGLLLAYPQTTEDPQAPVLIFPATPEGARKFEALKDGNMTLAEIQAANPLPDPEKPNIFTLYEQNIGPLTPMVAEVLKADAEIYPENWLREAMHEAVSRNIRNWKYVQAILKAWQEKGRDSTHGTTQSALERFRELYRQQKQQSSRKP
jgi:DnaD/phage-associated family protein